VNDPYGPLSEDLVKSLDSREELRRHRDQLYWDTQRPFDKRESGGGK
jgi:hypothetical protein